MERIAQIRQLILRSRRVPWLILGLTLLVLAGAIAVTTWQVRKAIRLQITRRDAEVLHAAVLMEYENDAAQGIAGPISDVGSQLNIVLQSSRLRGVLGIRLLNPDGDFVGAFPPYVTEGRLRARDLPELQALQPISRFHPSLSAAALFYPENGETNLTRTMLPVLEVNVPLHSREQPDLAGIAQFLLEGHSIATEYGQLDRHLILQAVVAFMVASGILAFAMAWAFRRLRYTQNLLAERSNRLLKANQELAMAAKTNALGTVAAHLIHGLKNPLAGLQSYVAAQGGSSGRSDEEDWQQAIASTRRMQSMINQVVSVLREEQSGAAYEVSLVELEEMVTQRVAALAEASGIQLRTDCRAAMDLPNRTANLLALILTNLTQNAIEATAPPGTVTLSMAEADGQLVLEVRDEGPGFPDGQTPFVPCRSTKEGGSGIGLALCKQLANHLGADLELQNSTDCGCVFSLRLPAFLSPSPGKAVSVSSIG